MKNKYEIVITNLETNEIEVEEKFSMISGHLFSFPKTTEEIHSSRDTSEMFFRPKESPYVVQSVIRSLLLGSPQVVWKDQD